MGLFLFERTDMANPLEVDNVPDDGAILSITGRGIILAAGDTVPAEASEGYVPGCLFIHIDGAAGSCLYVNDGTKASSDFDAFADQ